MSFPFFFLVLHVGKKDPSSLPWGRRRCRIPACRRVRKAPWNSAGRYRGAITPETWGNEFFLKNEQRSTRILTKSYSKFLFNNKVLNLKIWRYIHFCFGYRWKYCALMKILQYFYILSRLLKLNRTKILLFQNFIFNKIIELIILKIFLRNYQTHRWQ